VRHPIDGFVLAAAGAGRPAARARGDRRTVIRRATFDLLGLPPSREEIEAFLADGSPEAYERLVDRLLASPQYGERGAGAGWTWRATRTRTASTRTWPTSTRTGTATGWGARAEGGPALRPLRPRGWGGDLLPAPADPAHSHDAVVATGFLMLGPKILAEQRAWPTP
jgi:hypothetical protein